MRIAVLEWVCGGGMAASVDPTPGMQVDELSGLRDEGWAMLSCIAKGCAAAGHDVCVALSREVAANSASLSVGTQIVKIDSAGGGLSPHGVPQAWLRLVADCDLAIVIAPECEGILEACISTLKGISPLLLNCTGPFLSSAACKWKTACRQEELAIPHPPTRRLHEVDAAWLERARVSCGRRHEPVQWVVKPTDGAGCGELKILSDRQLQSLLRISIGASSCAGSRQIVQPLLPGTALSCSAIISAGNKAHWLPLVRQRLEPRPAAECIAMQSWGGELWGQRQRLPPCEPLLNRVLEACGAGAAGWIGIDLLYCESTQQWTIIEINPRFTTSVVALSAAYQGNLIGDFLSVCTGGLDRLSAFAAPGVP